MTPATLFTILTFSVNSFFIASVVIRLYSSSLKGFQLHNKFKKFNYKSKPEKDWDLEGSPHSIEPKVGVVKFENTFCYLLIHYWTYSRGDYYKYLFFVRKYWASTLCKDFQHRSIFSFILSEHLRNWYVFSYKLKRK